MKAKSKRPDWATDEGRIVFDRKLGFMFIKKNGRSERWHGYVQAEDGYVEVEGSDYQSLDSCRDSCVNAIAGSIERSVIALHPGARHTHLRRRYQEHICGAPYHLNTESDVSKVTCPLCLAIVGEEVAEKAATLGAAFEEAQHRAREVRMANAFGRLVNNENVTDTYHR